MMKLSRSEEVQILLLEVQPEIVQASKTVPPDRLKRAAAFCKEFALLAGIPITATLVPMGNNRPKLIEELGDLEPLIRTSISALNDSTVKDRIETYRRPVLIVAGVSSEIAILHTALGARGAGFEVLIAHDICGGLDTRTEQAAFDQMGRAGVVHTSLTSIAAGLIGDMASEAGTSMMGAIARYQSWS